MVIGVKPVNFHLYTNFYIRISRFPFPYITLRSHRMRNSQSVKFIKKMPFCEISYTFFVFRFHLHSFIIKEKIKKKNSNISKKKMKNHKTSAPIVENNIRGRIQ